MRRRSLTGPDLRDFAPDVLVAGGGNAGLCAAIAAREAGASVLLLEAAPREFRGGNSRHTRNLRYVHSSADALMTGQYPEEEFWDDLKRVTGGKTNEALARLAIRASADLGTWMTRRGVRFQPPLSGTLHLGRTNAFFLGGGKALVNAYYRAAEALGVATAYDAEVEDLELRDGRFGSALVRYRGERLEVRARTPIRSAGSPTLSVSTGPRSKGRCGGTMNRCALGRSIRLRSTDAAPRDSIHPRPIGRLPSIARRSPGTRSGRASPSRTSGSPLIQAGEVVPIYGEDFLNKPRYPLPPWDKR